MRGIVVPRPVLPHPPALVPLLPVRPKPPHAQASAPLVELAARKGRWMHAAAAIGSIIKKNASISSADVGCQGEVGSAVAMGAAGLAAALGGSNEQVENAAEIALEHSLGLTCDPVGGLVQIPCIERNAVASVRAINAARLALHCDGIHRVTLGSGYRNHAADGARHETEMQGNLEGGLAVNVPQC